MSKRIKMSWGGGEKHRIGKQQKRQNGHPWGSRGRRRAQLANRQGKVSRHEIGKAKRHAQPRANEQGARAGKAKGGDRSE